MTDRIADLIAEGQAAAPAADGSLTRRLTDALTRLSHGGDRLAAALGHHDRLIRRTTQLTLHDGTVVDCGCTWSYARPGVRTNIPADCPIHGGAT